MDDIRTDAKKAALKKKKTKRTISIIIIAVVLVALGVGGYLLYQYLNKKDAGVSETTYRVSAVQEGEISSVISGSGTLSALSSQSETAYADATIEKIYKQSGDAVEKGELLMTLKSDTLSDQIDTAKEDLQAVREEIAGTTQLRTSSELLIKPGKKGVVKDLCVEAGDLVDGRDYLCLISTDGRMKLEITATDQMKKYDAVTVDISGSTESGYIYDIADGVASVVIDDNSYNMNASATVYAEDGTKLGSGTLTVNEYIKVTAAAGQVESVYVEENETVGASRKLLKLKKGAPTDDYVALKKEEATLAQQLADLEDSLDIKAKMDGVITTVSVKTGDEVVAGDALLEVAGDSGYTMTLSIDELDISSVKHGQNVTITLDALSDQEFTGTVSNISFSGSGSYVTSYTVTVETAQIEGAYPGMSASAEIITDTSGTGLVVSVNAVQYDDDENAFVYLAGDEQPGTSKTESELDLTTLEKCSVTTGMSDGNYISITGEGLAAGDKIWVPQVTTSAVYTEDDSTTTTFSGMGGMGGGMPGDMGGGFPSGNMGGGMPGNMGGNMGGGSRSGN